MVGSMTVQELIDQLEQFDPNAPVLGAWENVVQEVEVYRAATGTILIDASGSDYKARHQDILGGCVLAYCHHQYPHSPRQGAV